MNKGQIQSFPVNTWKEEFNKAQDAGLSNIEWIFEVETEQHNPIKNDRGIREIRKQVQECGVEVNSICADWFMTHRLIHNNAAINTVAKTKLIELINQASKLEITYIVLPFVDSSSLNTPEQIDSAIYFLSEFTSYAEVAGIELHLETDLPPHTLGDIFSKLDHPMIRANYDIGNSASNGYNPQEEFAAIGSKIGSIHIKDRLLHGTSVPLGAGAADISLCIKLIETSKFDRFLILQTARVPGLDETSLANYNRFFIETIISQSNSVDL